MTISNIPRTYTVDEFDEELGVPTETVKRWCNADDLDYARTPGGDRRIPHLELLRLTGHDKSRDRVAIYARVSSPDHKRDGHHDR